MKAKSQYTNIHQSNHRNIQEGLSLQLNHKQFGLEPHNYPKFTHMTTAIQNNFFYIYAYKQMLAAVFMCIFVQGGVEPGEGVSL